MKNGLAIKERVKRGKLSAKEAMRVLIENAIATAPERKLPTDAAIKHAVDSATGKWLRNRIDGGAR